MKVLRRDVNFGLLLIIIATLICFSVFTVQYQQTFRNLSSNYYGKLDELEKVADSLTLEKTKLNQTSYQLQIKEKRESELSDIYTDLRTEKEKVEDELKIVKETLEEERTNLMNTQTELSTTLSELTSTKSDLQGCFEENNNLRDEVNDLEDQIDTMCTCN